MTQIWGALVILIICPLWGGLPLIDWITRILSRRQLANIGTGNISVSAAFYHGGKLAGILAVLSEAVKGITAVLLARGLFPNNPAWELIALIALVVGRYFFGKGAGTTNVVWGFVVHDPRVALLVFIIGGISFTIVRERQWGKIGVLILFPLITALLHPQDGGRILAAIALAVLLGEIYKKIPDDLDLPTAAAQPQTQKMFRFFRSDRSIITLNHDLDAAVVGQKAATLSHLLRSCYPVPMGWVLPPGDDPQPLLEYLQPSTTNPLVVRSSAIGEDSQQASAAGQYESILHVTTVQDLLAAINQCQASYDAPVAVQYRRDRGLPDAAMAVLIQKQVRGVFSGVAFSRDPITQQGDAVVIEALPGSAQQVVSGQVTPEQYRVIVNSDLPQDLQTSNYTSLAVEGEGDVPPHLLQQVAYLARHLENRFHGIPQDIEWSYDGEKLWLLQARPITTLIPIWTRKIAAEVIPGLIRPLTWSINRPLTCGVWGEIFTLVLAKQSRDLDFKQTATLHYSRAYFNATLLGEIFRRMGLPPESLEFLTRGAKFSKPPLSSTLRNLPGLLRLLRRELQLQRDFLQDERRLFAPGLSQLAQEKLDGISPQVILWRVDLILELLRRATYYSILAPLSAALRQAIFRVQDGDIDNSMTPEVAALRSLTDLASRVTGIIPSSGAVLEELEKTAQGRECLREFDEILQRYGYLSQVGTDIAVPTWKEEPQVVRDLFVGLMGNEPPRSQGNTEGRKIAWIQGRVDLKGRVTEVYSRLLAELRWSFVALERVWLELGWLREAGDIFFLEFDEIRGVVEGKDSGLAGQLGDLVERRRCQLAIDGKLESVPPLFYGNEAPLLGIRDWGLETRDLAVLKGIAASPGQVEGQVKVLRSLQGASGIDRGTILVVPYTDSGWAPLLARAGGLIAEVGGRLSHGAIVAREYGIPAVMDIHNATQVLRDGQWVRIDGQQGTVELLNK
ncbi:MAG: glycerol-3-phosphate acyltransferase [Nostocaceae cyanobacterium]|nr:glycerol-3-phosphate acyltransferase [Nostocaceae cyanobacterium]